jgi:myo-inositol-1(or 4)-monophosphatase
MSDRSSEAQVDDTALLEGMAAAARAAGDHMIDRFGATPTFRTRADVVEAIEANDAASLSVLRPMLTELRPEAGWVEDELEEGELPAGEWWVTDPVEGNVNHAHGLPEWGVTATLVRDGVPTLTAVYIPLSNDMYLASTGHGATQNGQRLQVTTKQDLDAAIVGTGQASPREGAKTFRQIGASSTAMLAGSLVLRVSVPATLQLIHVAAGRMDVFWQLSAVRSGLLAGALLVQEAGGAILDRDGSPWTLASRSFLATSPALADQAVAILSSDEAAER